MENNIHQRQINIEDDSFKKLIYAFSEKALVEFLNYLGNILNQPLSLWIFGEIGHLLHYEPFTNTNRLPSFCKLISSKGICAQIFQRCSDIDKKSIEKFLQDVKGGGIAEQKYTIAKCHLGISRIIFPITEKDGITGALIVGKFRVGDLEETKKINRRAESFIEQFFEKLKGYDNKYLKEELIETVEGIPTLTSQDIDGIEKTIIPHFPFLNLLVKYYSPRGQEIRSIIFLEELQKVFPSIVSTENDLWVAVTAYFQKTIEQLPLKSAILFYSEKDRSIDLIPKVKIPNNGLSPATLTLESNDEFLGLAQLNSGLILPQQKGGLLSWFTEYYMEKYFSSKDAIIYTKRVFDGKLILIGYGFIDHKKLSDFEKLLLKRSALRLFDMINIALANIETDNLMLETSHMLRRATAKIESGFADLKEFGLNIQINDSLEIKKAKENIIPSIENGLFRLDLIIRNFKAFKNLREATSQIQYGEQVDNNQEVDVISILKLNMNMLTMDLQKEGKWFTFDCLVKDWKLNTNKDLFSLMLMNILDNACNFSYSNTFVEIVIRETPNERIIRISNLGIGVAESEYELVFDKYYQSIYTSPNKKRTGTGIGLTFCKRFMELFFPDGSISIISKPNKTRQSHFDGDNFNTTISLIFKKN